MIEGCGSSTEGVLEERTTSKTVEEEVSNFRVGGTFPDPEETPQEGRVQVETFRERWVEHNGCGDLG